MAVLLTTQKALEQVQELPFCYLCGRGLEAHEKVNRDHVPPRGLFAVADRDTPLILRTHEFCNASQSKDDQAIGQLVGLLHGRAPNLQHNKLNMEVGRFQGGSTTAALTGLDLRGIIRRWLRAFHAALYREPLPESALFSTYAPFPEGEPEDQGVRIAPIPEVFPKFVEELKRNRATATLDRILCRNGKCRYECVWARADNGTWICIYCLDLYDWIQLGDINNFPLRGCVGCYARPQRGVPYYASTGTQVLFSLGNRSPYDPFAKE